MSKSKYTLDQVLALDEKYVTNWEEVSSVFGWNDSTGIHWFCYLITDKKGKVINRSQIRKGTNN